MSLKVREKTIHIGEHELKLRPTSLAGVDRALAAMDELPLEELVPAFLDLAQSTRLDEKEKAGLEAKVRKALGDDADDLAVQTAVAEQAAKLQNEKMLTKIPEFLTVAKPILGRQMMPAITTMVIAACESPHMVKQLQKRGELEEECGLEIDEDDAFVGCKGLRKFVKNRLFGIEQAVDLLIAAVEVNNIAGSVGKMVARVMPGSSEESNKAEATAST